MAEKTSFLDDFERDFKKGIGIEVNLTPQRFVVGTSKDNIKNFADAVGDANPLWINEEYARKSCFRGITAPPTFLYNVNHGTGPALAPPGKSHPRDSALLYAGAELEFFRPIRLGDEFTVKGRAVEIYRKLSQSLGPMLFTTGAAYYYNQKQELIGIIRTTIC